MYHLNSNYWVFWTIRLFRIMMFYCNCIKIRVGVEPSVTFINQSELWAWIMNNKIWYNIFSIRRKIGETSKIEEPFQCHGFVCLSDMGGSRGGLEVHIPLKNHANMGFSYQYSPGSPEKSQSYQASIKCWAIIGTPAKRLLNGVTLASRWWPAYSGICLFWILSPL